MIDLDSLSKEEHYDIPADYFEQFPQQVMSKIRKEKSKKRNIFMAAIAAVAAIVICSTILVHYYKPNDTGKEVIAEGISDEEQIEEQMIDYYSSELAQMDYLNY